MLSPLSVIYVCLLELSPIQMLTMRFLSFCSGLVKILSTWCDLVSIECARAAPIHTALKV